MTNSFVKFEIYKDDGGDVNIDINSDIYYEDRELYQLTSQLPRWRNTAIEFTTGEEDAPKWIRRVHTYVDHLLNRMGWDRRRDVSQLIFQTNFYPGQYGHVPTGHRSFMIEIQTRKTALPPRNRLPF